MEPTDSSKRLIAKNSVFLFFRSIVMMLIGLYASRVLLGKLGIEDFGIYNIVGGVVLMFNSLRSLFSNAIQRFLNYARGLGVERRLNQVFVTGLQVQVILSVFFLVLAETVGLYAFLHLNIPEGRSYAALGEHRNEHQLATARKFKELGSAYVAMNEEELKALLLRKDLKPLAEIGEYASQSLIDSIEEFIG